MSPLFITSRSNSDNGLSFAETFFNVTIRPLRIMEALRRLALSSYVYEEVRRILKIEKRNVAEFLIDVAGQADTIESFSDLLNSRKATIPPALARNVFEIVHRYRATHLAWAVPPEQAVGDPPPALPRVGEIHRGRVTSLNHHGAFVRLDGLPSRPVGFCHLREILREPPSTVTPMDVLRVNERVFVQVIDAQVTDLSLSMLDIDQATGEPAESGLGRGAVQKLGGVRVPSPDRFELDQLMNAGALRPEDAPEFAHSSMGVLSLVGPLEEEFEIVLNTNVPPFLAGLKRAKRSIDPIRVESNAEGSLGRAARDAALLSRQRVDQRKMTAGLLDDEAPPVIPTVSLSELPEWKRQTFGSFGPRVQKPKNDLPIAFFRERIRQMVNENRVFILIGETGSGKTTQIPQYLHEWGITEKLIAVTQPRRVAAISVAKRVAQEMNTAVGNLVGYCVRFEECVSAATHIRYVTDGMLLKECLTDHSLANYGVVMLDEAHERTIHTDVLFGLMKEILNDESSDLKVIVTSATLQQQKFSEFFNNCPILPIPGRMFPVQVSFATKAFTDYLQASVQAVLALHKSEELPGDILLFLTGQEDIDSACELLYEQGKRMAEEYGELIVLPIYSTLPSEQQSLIFEPTPPNSRKVVVATNIAETSITIDGIRFVVDPGFVKEMWYDSKVGMDTLKIVPISKAAANQRKGRAGRTAPGKCVRLYTQAAYTREMADASIPEIQRSNIAMVALQLKAMGIDNLIAFEFMDKPQTATIVDGLEQLYQLGALDEEGNLTALGLKMAQFPLNPQLSKMLIVSADLGCSRDILALVAILSVQGIWYRPRARQAAADAMKARLDREEGDHITLLHVYKEWLSADRSEQWCRDHFIHYRSLRRAEEVIHQLERLMERFRLPLHSSGTDTQRILKAIVAGFFTRAARKDGQRGYQTLVDNHVVHMFPGSSLFGREPDFVVFHELVNTTREYMRNTIAVDPRWLVELAPAFYRRASPEEITERKRNERLTPLSDNLRRHERDWRITEQRIVRL